MTQILDRFRLDDRVALVTGAGRGIGAATAIAFAEAGADVVCAARTREQLEETAAAIEKVGRRASIVRCDVMNPADRQAAIDCAIADFGRLDLLVNNAGGWGPAAAMNTTPAQLDKAFAFNVTQAFAFTQACVPHMVKTAGRGAVINISSRAGSIVQQNFSAYGTAKAALNFLTKDLAAEFAPKVRVNAIACGPIATAALDTVLSPEIKKMMETRTPMQRIGDVEDVAACAIYLASDASCWVTGKIIDVDGGGESPPLDMPTPPL